MKVIITGASGLIGRHLIRGLAARGDAAVALTRGGDAVSGALTLTWDPVTGGIPGKALEGTDAIVNLAGAGIGDGRWSDRRRHEILESRLVATQRCVAAITAGGPSILVNASATGYYGAGTTEIDESGPPGGDFLASVCVAWESEAIQAEAAGARVVRLRSGMVLSGDGGALPRLLTPARLGAGGPIGGGRQWQSWIHIADEVGIILQALTTDLSGPLNAVSPRPVQQRDFARVLGAVLHRPAVVPLPGLVLRTALGAQAAIVLEGQRVVPRVALDAGYNFRFPDVEAALRDLLS